jgi:16S rRNA G966 N2-methylase RsmD
MNHNHNYNNNYCRTYGRKNNYNNRNHNYSNDYRHNNKNILRYKLFPCPPSKNFNNLMIDIEAVTFITTPMNSEIIATIIESLIPKNISRSDITIFDGTACVGGDSITFGKMFGTVVASEIEKHRYDMLVNNLREFELTNVVPINEDCLNVYKRLNFVDIMYFDPPWGGKKYKEEKNLRLSIGNKFVDELVNDIFEINPNKLSIRSDVKIVALKLPKNYDLYHLYQKTKNLDVTMLMYELNKMILIVFKRNNYVDKFSTDLLE